MSKACWSEEFRTGLPGKLELGAGTYSVCHAVYCWEVLIGCGGFDKGSSTRSLTAFRWRGGFFNSEEIFSQHVRLSREDFSGVILLREVFRDDFSYSRR